MKTFFGFAVADSMFPTNCTINKEGLPVDTVMEEVAAGVVPCLNPSHTATIEAMKVRYGLEIAIPEKAPFASLGVGDSVIVMGVRGLPRLEGRHEYTEEEIAKASFTFSKYTVIG